MTETISAGAAEARTITVGLGSTLRLTVEADTLDSVQVEGLELFAGVAPETPAQFDVLADTPGLYDVRLVEADRIVGRLEVSPQR